MRALKRTTSVLFGLLLLSTQVWASDRVDSGKKTAMRWCASCHVVVEGQGAAFTATPTFREIAQKYQDSPNTLEAFLTAPQHPMPDISLTRDDVRDLSAYIRSLE